MTTPTTHLTRWDRAAIIVLGAAGCCLSYDALQQMAVAIHVRGLLTYLFPLVIDGFIAYGVRALLVLRNAPLRARLYVWTLFGTATAASIWANALHAVRLNQQATVTSGLRLGNAVVAVLSTLAPLALAGAVHLYIIIARGPARASDRGDRDSDRGQYGQPGHSGQAERVSVTRTGGAGQPPTAGQVTAGQPVTALPASPGHDSDRPALSELTGHPLTRTVTEGNGSPDSTESDPIAGPDLGGQPDATTPDTSPPVTVQPVTVPPVTRGAVSDRLESPVPVTDRVSRTAGDRGADPDTDRLLEIAREAVKAQDKLTRKVVAQAIRGQEIPLSNDRLTALMVRLRETPGQHTADRLP